MKKIYHLLSLAMLVPMLLSATDTITLSGTLRDFPKSNIDFQNPSLTLESKHKAQYCVKGLVKDTLTDGVPILKNWGKGTIDDGSNEEWKAIFGPYSFVNWFKDVSGTNKSMKYDLTLTKQGNYYVYDSDNDNGFFPLDGKGFGNEGNKHNFHFTYHIHSQFTYNGGEILTFSGDDDVWVFINGKLALDIGGIHNPVEKTLNLDAKANQLDISKGGTYDFDLFYAERFTPGANLKITTNMQIGKANHVSPSPTPFSCESKSFISFNTVPNYPARGDSQFDTIKLSDGKLQNHDVLSGVHGVNSIGYNIKDNFIWGYNLGSNKLVKIGANNEVETFDVPGRYQHEYVAADVDKKGVMYLASRNTNTIYKVDLQTKPKQWSTLRLDKTINTADMAFNPKNGFLYFIQDGSGGELYKINPQTGRVSFVVDASDGNPEVIISFFDRDGNFYFNQEKDSLYKIDMNNPVKQTAPFAHLDKDLKNGDGARCANAPLDLTPTPTHAPNAMLLTRGKEPNESRTNIYAFYVDPQTDKISDFHQIGSEITRKFRSLAYKDGKYYTVATDNGEIYTIDIDNGHLEKANEFVQFNIPDVVSMDFDDYGNIIYTNSDNKVKKYDLSSHTSSDYKTLSEKTGQAIAWMGNGKYDVSLSSGGVLPITNSNQGNIVGSSEDCIYGGEKVSDNKAYFVNAEAKKKKLKIYKLTGTSWESFYDYGLKTGGLKAEAIAVEHEREVLTPSNLIADYHFDECDYNGTNDEVKDSLGSFNLDTRNGVTTSLDGVVNRSAKFDGGSFA
ncbi:MAG: hypothetical protein DSZ06_04065, partial [Sulfurospirillum sp.]